MAITQTITVLPTPPSRADPANFDTRADGFLSALPTMQTEMNTWAGQANTMAAEIGIEEDGLTSVTPAANKVPKADGDGEIALSWLDLTGYATAAQGVTNGNSHDHNGGDGAQIAYANLSGLPTLGTAAATASSDYAPAAQGVTNGNLHDHNGGDGGQIAYANLSGLPTLGTAAATATTDYVAASFLGHQIGYRNVIVNGDFSVWGLGTSGFSSYGRSADCWLFGWAGTSPSPVQGAAYGAFPFHLSWTGAIGNTYVQALTSIESSSTRRLVAVSKITLSGYIYGPAGGFVYIEIKTAGATDDFSSTTSRADTTVTLATTGWQYFTLSYTSPHADVAKGVQLSFYVETCTSGTWGITGIQLEAGDATPFEHRPAAIEQQLCHRYFRTGNFYVPATTAQNLGIVDMFKTPTISGGGAGFTSTGTTKDNLIAYQTTGGVQTLKLEAYV